MPQKKDTLIFEFGEGERIEVTYQNGEVAGVRHTFTMDAESEDDEDGEETIDPFLQAIDGITSLILAQGKAGIDLRTEAYAESLQVAVEALANQYL